MNRSVTSNIVTTSLQNANIISVKQANVTFVSIVAKILLTNTLQNIGTVPANNTVFIDNIPEGTIFIKDSLSINNVIQPGPNPEIGVTLDTIQPNETVTISFQVQLTNIPRATQSLTFQTLRMNTKLTLVLRLFSVDHYQMQ